MLARLERRSRAVDCVETETIVLTELETAADSPLEQEFDRRDRRRGRSRPSPLEADRRLAAARDALPVIFQAGKEEAGGRDDANSVISPGMSYRCISAMAIAVSHNATACT